MMIATTKESITDDGARAGRSIPAGTVLLSFKLSIGKVGITERPMFTNEAIAALPIRDSTRVAPRYLAHVLRSLSLSDRANRAAMGATLNKGTVSAVPVPLPPIEEQLRLAAILDQADGLLALRRRSLDLLDDLSEAIFRDTFGSLPATATQPLGRVADLRGGVQVTATRKSMPLQVPYLRVANVARDRVALAEVKAMGVTAAELARTDLLPGDLLVVEGHGNQDEVGRCAIWSGEISPCTHQNHLMRVRCDPSRLSAAFVAACINSTAGRRYMRSVAKTTSGLNTINMTNLKNFPLPVATLEMQRMFEARQKAVRALGSPTEAAAVVERLASCLRDTAFAGDL